jgi:hypothetical protein
MARYVVSGMAELECSDALSAWQEAHLNTQKLTWEVASVAPLDNPTMAIKFTTRIGGRVARARLQRAIALTLLFLLALSFPSHLVVSSLLTGRW